MDEIGRHRQSLPRENATRLIDADGQVRVSRAESMSTPIWTCHSAARPAPTTLRPALAPPPSVAPRRSSTSPSSTKANPCAPPSTLGCKKLQQGGLPTTDFTASSPICRTPSWTKCRTGARRRFQFQALHGLPGRVHARRCQHLQGHCATSENAGAMVCMHAENGGAIDVIVQAGPGRRQTGSQVSRPHSARPPPKPKLPLAPSLWPKWPAPRCTSCI